MSSLISIIGCACCSPDEDSPTPRPVMEILGIQRAVSDCGFQISVPTEALPPAEDLNARRSLAGRYHRRELTTNTTGIWTSEQSAPGTGFGTRDERTFSRNLTQTRSLVENEGELICAPLETHEVISGSRDFKRISASLSSYEVEWRVGPGGFDWREVPGSRQYTTINILEESYSGHFETGQPTVGTLHRTTRYFKFPGSSEYPQPPNNPGDRFTVTGTLVVESVTLPGSVPSGFNPAVISRDFSGLTYTETLLSSYEGEEGSQNSSGSNVTVWLDPWDGEYAMSYIQGGISSVLSSTDFSGLLHNSSMILRTRSPFTRESFRIPDPSSQTAFTSTVTEDNDDFKVISGGASRGSYYRLGVPNSHDGPVYEVRWNEIFLEGMRITDTGGIVPIYPWKPLPTPSVGGNKYWKWTGPRGGVSGSFVPEDRTSPTYKINPPSSEGVILLGNVYYRGNKYEKWKLLENGQVWNTV